MSNKKKIKNRLREDDDYVIYTESSKRHRIIKKNIASGSWTLKENQIYLGFLQAHQKLFQNEFVRRSSKVFRKMSSILRRRDSEQCRSHHQKLGLRFDSDLQKIMDHLRKKTGKMLEYQEEDRLKNLKNSEVGSKDKLKEKSGLLTGAQEEELLNGFKIRNPKQGEIMLIIDIDRLVSW